MSIERARRYYLLKRRVAAQRADDSLAAAWQAKQEGEPGIPLVPSFPFRSRLAAAGYVAPEDLDGATVEELQQAGFTKREAEKILATELVGESASPLFHTYLWEPKNENANAFYSPVDGAALVFFKGRWLHLGGWNNTVGYQFPGPTPPGTLVNTTNRILESSDLKTWSTLLAHDHSPPVFGNGARWKRRHTFPCFEHEGYLYVGPGDHESATDPDFSGSPSNGYQCDWWRSPDAVTWDRRLASNASPIAGRMLSVGGCSPGKIWVFGGQNGILGGVTTVFNDLYCSTDGAASFSQVWSQDPAAVGRPSPRGMISKLVYHPKLKRVFIIGGGTHDTSTMPVRTYFREVWSFDPDNPNDVKQHATPPWDGVEYNSADWFGNRLVTFGGFSFGLDTRHGWASDEGDRWTQFERAPFPRSHADAVGVSGNVLARASGNADVDTNTSRVYALIATPRSAELSVPTSLLRASWGDQPPLFNGNNITQITDTTGNGKHLVPTAPGDATRNAADSDYRNSPPSANTDGGRFLKTAAPVDLSAWDLFLVLRPVATAGLFYYCYALTTGPTQYMYLAGSRTDVNRLTLSSDVRRSGVNMTGQQGIVVMDDRPLLLSWHHTGVAATSFVRINGAQVFPDDAAFVGDLGAPAWDAVLNILSDNNGDGSKAGSFVAGRLFAPLSYLEQFHAVERELTEKYLR